MKILFALLTLGLAVAGDAAEFGRCRVTGQTAAGVVESENSRDTKLGAYDVQGTCVLNELHLPTAGVSLMSPDGMLALEFSSDVKGLRWSLKNEGKEIVKSSAMGLRFAQMSDLGEMSIRNVIRRSSDTTWENPFYRRLYVRDHFNEMIVELEEMEPRGVCLLIGTDKGAAVARRLSLVFRAYDEGVAFRYVIPEQLAFEGFQLLDEDTEWRFADDAEGWTTTYPKQFTSQEEPFKKGKIGAVDPKRFIGSPVLVESAGRTLGICEAALSNWAGLFLKARMDAARHEAVLTAALARLPPSEASVSNVAVIRRTPAASPWRVVMVGRDELDLIRKNDIIVNLNPPPEEGMDFSWVKPGPSSWDWWVESNNSLSTELTLKLVDFAAEMGWSYHTIDGGWYGFARRPNHGPNVELEPRKGFDLKRIVEHATAKGIGIWVWIHWQEIEDTGIEETFARLEKWGVKGVKTDFINRQDQWIVCWYERVCRAAAKHHILVNFHGAHKPTGTERTWPNNLTREGILGNEMNIFASRITPEHCATLPFTRFLIGPGDFTPGSFANVYSKDFVPQVKKGHRYGDETDRCPHWAEEMGTRAHSIAQCVAFDGGLTTLCDWPERYRGAAGVDALRRLPTTWKTTTPVAGVCGEYYAVAREAHDGRLYFAAITVKPRKIDLKLDFLDDGEWTMESYVDDPEATPEDAKRIKTDSRIVRREQVVSFNLTNEGGAVAVFSRKLRDM